jgi:hypothetical protein
MTKTGAIEDDCLQFEMELIAGDNDMITEVVWNCFDFKFTV